MKIRFAKIDNSITWVSKFRRISTSGRHILIIFTVCDHFFRFDIELGTLFFLTNIKIEGHRTVINVIRVVWSLVNWRHSVEAADGNV